MQKEIEKLVKQMRKINIFMYFFRNNPRYTNRFYHQFIQIVGYENYREMLSIKNEWDGARYSFDKMYGLLSAWQYNCEKITSESVNSLKASVEKLLYEIDHAKDSFQIDDGRVVSALKNISDDNEAESLLKEYSQLKKELLVSEEEKIKKPTLSKKVEHSATLIKIYKQYYELLKNYE